MKLHVYVRLSNLSTIDCGLKLKVSSSPATVILFCLQHGCNAGAFVDTHGMLSLQRNASTTSSSHRAWTKSPTEENKGFFACALRQIPSGAISLDIGSKQVCFKVDSFSYYKSTHSLVYKCCKSMFCLTNCMKAGSPLHISTHMFKCEHFSITNSFS